MDAKKNLKLDVIVVGGGFYGCMLSLELKKTFANVLLIEKEDILLTKASYNNQARVHNGYHYPRSFITGLRSHRNYQKFILDFKPAIDDTFLMTYAIARNNSKVTSQQFKKFCEQIGAPLRQAPIKIQKLFNEALIEDIFTVDEVVFNAKKVREILEDRLHVAKVKILYKEEVIKVTSDNSKNLHIQLKKGKTITGSYVYNCTYSQINTILKQTHLPILPFKYEITEMPLITMPDQLMRLGVTVMDGPFFSVMPFPDKKLHTIHHVRYTPQESWVGIAKQDKILERKSMFAFMKKDASRYIPMLSQMKYIDSLFEVKTVLLSNEENDRRPILYVRNYGIKNFHLVMGGKIDNVYDVINEIKNI